MISKTSILILVTVFSFVYCFDKDDYLSTKLNQFDIYNRNSRAECTQLGSICDNCTDVVFCVTNPAGGYDKFNLETCSDGKTCLNGACTDAENDACDSAITDYIFECHQPGIFPDPYDCKKYHLCNYNAEEGIIIESTIINCPAGYGFDVYRLICVMELVDNKCPPKLVEPCNGVGIGPIPGNPNLFYMCLQIMIDGILRYMPQIFFCEKNYVFSDNRCVNPHPIGVVNGRCTRTGSFYDPTDCRKYKKCTEVEEIPTEKKCLLNYRFHALSETCEKFSCEN